MKTLDFRGSRGVLWVCVPVIPGAGERERGIKESLIPLSLRQVKLSRRNDGMRTSGLIYVRLSRHLQPSSIARAKHDHDNRN